MPIDPAGRLINHLYRCVLPSEGGGQADGELLARFVERHDDAALAALVRRHAGMVWGVCVRALRNHDDAEDAFQATFLVLVRKASAVVPRELVGNWLYGVAHQVTLQVKRNIARRRAREVQVTDMPDTPAPQHGLSLGQRIVLDEELVKLPVNYRAVIVLCDLEGRTRKEVARLLGVPEGTVGGRLARARTMLGKRLRQRGIVFVGSVAAAASVGSASAAPSTLIASTIKAARLLAAGQAAATVSAKVVALTEGVVNLMFLSKLMAVLVVVLMLGFVATGATLLTGRTAAGQDDKKPAAEKSVQPPKKQASKVSALVPKQNKEPLTVWGNEAGGLQAGLGYLPGERRVHRPGETVKLVVRIRNVGTEPVSFQYLRHFFIENPPTVTDDKGKTVAFKDGSPRGIYKPIDVTLTPGMEIDLYELSLTLSDKAADTPHASTLYGEGTFRLQYVRILGNSSLSSAPIRTGPILKMLATGTLDLVVNRGIQRSAAGQPKKALSKEVDLLQGEWAVTAWEEEGEKATAADLKGKKAVIRGNEMAGVEPSLTGRMSFTLNAETTPKEINFTVLDGERKGTMEPGIYAREGRRLRLCFGGKVRPKGFVTTPGSGHTLLTLQKEPLKKELFPEQGKATSGLQAGLRFRFGEQRAYFLGEAVKLILRVRNLGMEKATFTIIHELLFKNVPTCEVRELTKPAGVRTTSIRSLLETSGRESRIVIVQETAGGKSGPADRAN